LYNQLVEESTFRRVDARLRTADVHWHKLLVNETSAVKSTMCFLRFFYNLLQNTAVAFKATFGTKDFARMWSR